MENAGIIFVTTESLEQAKKIAKVLVELRLAACVNISSPVTSIYHWDSQLQESQEFLLMIKALEKNYSKIEAKVKELHSYSNPEIIYMPITNGSKEYLKWLQD